jgi:hypothetical protein
VWGGPPVRDTVLSSGRNYDHLVLWDEFFIGRVLISCDVYTHAFEDSSWNTAIISALVRTENAGGDDTIAAVEDFRPGNTLHYWGVSDM